MLKAKEIIGSHKETYGIVGSHGFVGNHLFNRLESAGLNVVRLDRSGEVPKDVTVVFNCASYGNYIDQTDEDQIYTSNVSLPLKLMENCKGKKLVLVSSSSVLLETQTTYSKAKSEMEELAKKWVLTTRESVVILRPSTITGVGDNPKHLIPKLINSCFTQDQMNFVSEPTHDYIDISDFVNAMIFVSKKIDKLKGHIFNVSFGVAIPNGFVKDVISTITRREPNIKVIDSMRAYDTKNWKVVSDKLKQLGWSPKMNIIDSITEMVKDYEKRNTLPH